MYNKSFGTLDRNSKLYNFIKLTTIKINSFFICVVHLRNGLITQTRKLTKTEQKYNCKCVVESVFFFKLNLSITQPHWSSGFSYCGKDCLKTLYCWDHFCQVAFPPCLYMQKRLSVSWYCYVEILPSNIVSINRSWF